VIFVDTGAFVARYLARDEHHGAARRGFADLSSRGEAIATSGHVIDETVTLLGRWAGHAFAAARARAILASASLQILRAGLEQDLAALVEFERFADQAVSFTDCVSFVLMSEQGIRDVFGFDAEFRLAGFRLWPADTE
jgi:predicted nucleic acid-binding protein